MTCRCFSGSHLLQDYGSRRGTSGKTTDGVDFTSPYKVPGRRECPSTRSYRSDFTTETRPR